MTLGILCVYACARLPLVRLWLQMYTLLLRFCMVVWNLVASCLPCVRVCEWRHRCACTHALVCAPLRVCTLVRGLKCGCLGMNCMQITYTLDKDSYLTVEARDLDTERHKLWQQRGQIVVLKA